MRLKAWAIKTARGKIATERVPWGTAYVITRHKSSPWRRGEKVIRVEVKELAAKKKRK